MKIDYEEFKCLAAILPKRDHPIYKGSLKAEPIKLDPDPKRVTPVQESTYKAQQETKAALNNTLAKLRKKMNLKHDSMLMKDTVLLRKFQELDKSGDARVAYNTFTKAYAIWQAKLKIGNIMISTHEGNQTAVAFVRADRVGVGAGGPQLLVEPRDLRVGDREVASQRHLDLVSLVVPSRRRHGGRATHRSQRGGTSHRAGSISVVFVVPHGLLRRVHPFLQSLVEHVEPFVELVPELGRRCLSLLGELGDVEIVEPRHGDERTAVTPAGGTTVWSKGLARG